MVQRYGSASSGEDGLFDELLCEYVDGDVDQAVRATFDECMSVDKSLAERVETLRRTRRLLKQYRCSEATGVHLRVRKRLFRQVHVLQDGRSQRRSPFLLVGVCTVAVLILHAVLMPGTVGPVPAQQPGSVASMQDFALVGGLHMALPMPVPVSRRSAPAASHSFRTKSRSP